MQVQQEEIYTSCTEWHILEQAQQLHMYFHTQLYHQWYVYTSQPNPHYVHTGRNTVWPGLSVRTVEVYWLWCEYRGTHGMALLTTAACLRAYHWLAFISHSIPVNTYTNALTL